MVKGVKELLQILYPNADLDALVTPPGTSYYSETNINNLVALIKKYADKIGVITFATSPGFADQRAAIAAVKEIIAGVLQ